MTDEEYRVVIDGAGGRTGTVASSPRSYADAEAGLGIARDVFAADIGRGEMEVSVLSDAEYRQRAQR
jgi:hypothetical protein